MTSEGSAGYIEDLVGHTDPPVLNGKSEIAEFFAHTNILVTGGTGFLGKLLIEKLLRSCPDISKIYMIVRMKKGKSPEERFKENFDSIVYDRLRREQPDFLNKIVMLKGDGAEEDYGLTAESKEMLQDTNIIFHAAADVRFDETIRRAATVNVKGVKFLLAFAKQLPNFKVFLHVSTAFSNCVHSVIEETHYKDTIDSDKLLALVDALDDAKLDQITPVLLDQCPNTYVLSKALAENVVLKYGKEFPTCIVRPSIVIATSDEPIKAWINNLYGATGILMGSAIGFIRTLLCVSDNVADIIPADYVVSNIIAAAWDTYNRAAAVKFKNANLSDDEKVPIYNIVSSCQNPISWGEYMHQNETHAFEIPSRKVVWYYMLILNRYLFVHIVSSFFLHTIPAFTTDMIALSIGQKPRCLETYKKVNKFTNVISYFTMREWKFRNDNVVKLWEKMNPVDRQIFCFNIAMLDWTEYFYHHVRGIRIYLLNDPLNTIEEGKKKYRKLFIAHYSIVTAVIILVLWLVSVLLRFLGLF